MTTEPKNWPLIDGVAIPTESDIISEETAFQNALAAFENAVRRMNSRDRFASAAALMRQAAEVLKGNEVEK